MTHVRLIKLTLSFANGYGLALVKFCSPMARLINFIRNDHECNILYFHCIKGMHIGHSLTIFSIRMAVFFVVVFVIVRL